MIKDFILNIVIINKMVNLKTNINVDMTKYCIDINSFFSKFNFNKTQHKLNNEKLNYEDYDKLITHKSTIQQLKTIAKNHHLKTSGVKEELINRIYNYLRLSYYVRKIQKTYRKHIIHLYNKCHGPAIIYRNKCTNETDFLSLENVNKIPYSQFYSYIDSDNHIYGFDIISLYNWIDKSGEKCINPYNRTSFPSNIKQELNQLIKFSKIIHIPIFINVENEMNKMSIKQKIELSALSLFQKMDELGNYTDVKWFTSLSMHKRIMFLRELHDIWNYRAQLPNTTKRDIYPLNDIFYDININITNLIHLDYYQLNQLVLNVINKFINFGINKDSQYLGASYVLSALTLVNEDAASALPWLYQSVAHAF